MRTRAIAACSLMVLALSAGSEAAFISYGPFPYTAPDTGSVSTVMFPQFNPALGRLTSVTYALTQQSGSTVGVAFQNRAGQPILFGFVPYFSIDIKTPTLDSAPQTFFPPGFPPLNFQLAAYSGTPNFTGPDSLSGNVSFGPNGSETRTYIGPNFTDFLGTGIVSAQMTTSLQFFERTNLPPTTPPANLPAMKYLTSGTIFGNLTVTYNFAVPEPPSLFLVALGSACGLGLAFLRRPSPRST
jgi:hypothetical protein